MNAALWHGCLCELNLVSPLRDYARRPLSAAFVVVVVVCVRGQSRLFDASLQIIFYFLLFSSRYIHYDLHTLCSCRCCRSCNKVRVTEAMVKAVKRAVAPITGLRDESVRKQIEALSCVSMPHPAIRLVQES